MEGLLSQRRRFYYLLSVIALLVLAALAPLSSLTALLSLTRTTVRIAVTTVRPGGVELRADGGTLLLPVLLARLLVLVVALAIRLGRVVQRNDLGALLLVLLMLLARTSPVLGVIETPLQLSNDGRKRGTFGLLLAAASAAALLVTLALAGLELHIIAVLADASTARAAIPITSLAELNGTAIDVVSDDRLLHVRRGFANRRTIAITTVSSMVVLLVGREDSRLLQERPWWWGTDDHSLASGNGARLRSHSGSWGCSRCHRSS